MPNHFPKSALLTLTLVLALVGLFVSPAVSRAQHVFSIKITEPVEGANITGPFVVAGTSTVPFEGTPLLKVISTSTNEALIVQDLPVIGEAIGKDGTFRVTLNYSVAGTIPVLIQISYNFPKYGSAKDDVRVVLHRYDATPTPNAGGDQGALAAVQLALLDYEGRVQTTTPIPQSTADQTFGDQCLGLARTGETCAQGEVAGQVVKLSFGGAAFTYRVGNNQARLDESQSAPINRITNSGLSPLLSTAASIVGGKLYLPPKFTGPFAGLYFKHVDWDMGDQSATLTYGADNNPVEVKAVERYGNATPPPTKPNGETVQIGGAAVPVQVDAGRKTVEWLAQTTIISLSVPQSINTADLAALANGFALPGAQAGQVNLLDRTQFGKLTLNLPEPIRSAEMARQALLGLVKPARLGGLISIQAKQFKDACLELPRQGESCAGGTTPGFVIGVADSELYRYHVASGLVRLNRANSELKIKGNTDFASLDSARASVTFPLAAAGDPNVARIGIETGKVDTPSGAQPGALLVYRENKTGGVFALTETGSGALPGSTTQDQQITVNGKQVAVKSDPNGRTASLTMQDAGGKQVLVTLWASPEIGVEDITRILSSLVAS